MRTHIEWRSSSKEEYEKFCKKYPSIKLSYIEWKNILYSFNDLFKTHILETGDKVRLPQGFGEFSIIKKKRKRTKIFQNKEYVNLPIDWKKTKEKGKVIYNFNFHTEGYFFGWQWFKQSARIIFTNLWYFKPCRTTSRLLAHYINVDEKYQHIYKEWKI